MPEKLYFKRFLLLFTAIVFALSWPVLAGTEFSGGPGDGRTGAPGEGLCTDCHAGTANSGDGTFLISGVPAMYGSGATYILEVELQDPGQQRWGFELTAIDESGNGAGFFSVTDAVNTQLSDNVAPGKDYMKQTSSGTYNGTADGPVSWSFDWTAPDTSAGIVTFYAAGNAADANGSTSGDFVYTASAISDPSARGVTTTSTAGLIILALLMTITSAFIIKRYSLLGEKDGSV